MPFVIVVPQGRAVSRPSICKCLAHLRVTSRVSDGVQIHHSVRQSISKATTHHNGSNYSALGALQHGSALQSATVFCEANAACTRTCASIRWA